MHLCSALLGCSWFSLVAMAVVMMMVVAAARADSYEQKVIGGYGKEEDVSSSTTTTTRYNLTLHVSTYLPKDERVPVALL